MKKVLSHAERIQGLSLEVLDVILPKTFSLSAPRLEILDIGIETVFSPWPSIDYGDFPLLRVLKLTDCPLPWHSFNLSGVTTLFLPRVPAQNIVEFLAIVCRMQALIVLHLEHALSIPSGGAFSVSPTVNLPHLACLFVAAPLPTVVALLSCINIPLKTHSG